MISLKPSLSEWVTTLKEKAQLLIAKTANLIGQDRLDEAIETGEEAYRWLWRSVLATPYPNAIYPWYVMALRRKAESLPAVEHRERHRLLRSALRVGHIGILSTVLRPIEKPRLLREIAIALMIQGKNRRARWMLQWSIRSAKQQKTLMDYAESLQLLGELGLRDNCPKAVKQIEEAQEIKNRLRIEQAPDALRRDIVEPGVTMSLVDRFDTLLDVGRRISSALEEADVLDQTRQAALRLLRSEQCAIVGIDGREHKVLAGPSPFSLAAAKQAMSQTQTVVDSDGDRGSILCAPITVNDETIACLCVWHSSIRDMFGEDERRLAEFITTLTGAALESADSFQ